MAPTVAVVGAGVVGATTAHLLLERLGPSVDLTLIADQFETDTTSYGAAGSFRVSDRSLGPPERARRWCELSFARYHALACSEAAPSAGAFLLPLYEMSSSTEPPPQPLYACCCSDATRVTRTELAALGLPEECRGGFKYTSAMVEGRQYLPFLLEAFRRGGGTVERRRVESWAELAPDFDLAVNCTGLGARRLCGDESVVPVRGQVVRVRAPWLKRGLYLDKPTSYVYPGRDLVVLGGTRDPGVFDSTPSPADTATILARTRRLEPSLAHAPVEEVWAGLRPYRPQIRVEADPSSFPLPLVHNYGHGGHGVSVSYGTAVEAAELVERLLGFLKPRL